MCGIEIFQIKSVTNPNLAMVRKNEASLFRFFSKPSSSDLFNLKVTSPN